MSELEPLTIVREVKGGATYSYRGYQFTIERGAIMWWCHDGIKVPWARHAIGQPSEWSILGIGHEAGWGSLTKRAILHKLCRAINRDIKDWVREDGLGDRRLDARTAHQIGP